MGVLASVSSLKAELEMPVESMVRAVAAKGDRTGEVIVACEPHDHRRESRTHRPGPLAGEQLATAVTRCQTGGSLRSIAEDFGVSRTFMGSQLTKVGIEFRNRPISKEEIQIAAVLYQSGRSLAAIATRLGFTASTIHRALLREGVKMRDTQGRPRYS